MKTTITRPVVKRCSHRDETDYGELTIVFDGPAPELHDLSDIVDKLAARPVTHEDFTAELAAMFVETSATITTRWITGLWAVEVTECSTSATPQSRRVTP